MRGATIALLFATLFWGMGFTWAKRCQEAINHSAGVGERGALGPVLLLSIRFIVAGLLWLAIFPSARRGWSWVSVRRAGSIGAILGTGLTLQHLGLDQTSEAVSAFLTSLTVVFVPIIAAIALRRSPPVRTWLAVLIATAGVWMMTAAGQAGSFGAGELLGLLCAFVFSIHLFAVNFVVPRDEPFRMAGGQLIAVGMVALIVLLFLPGGAKWLAPARLGPIFALRDVWMNFALLIIFPTLMAFGFLTIYQPKLDATRAALLYLMEPIFATIYAMLIAGRTLRPVEMMGAGAILLANAVIELLDARAKRREPAGPAPHEIV